MRYYTIQNNSILIAENRQALERYYDNVLPLPKDYEEGKYIVEEGELVLNPNWKEEQAEKEKQAKIAEINSKIEELEKESVHDVLYGNKENVKVYQDVINGLVETRDNL